MHGTEGLSSIEKLGSLLGSGYVMQVSVFLKMFGDDHFQRRI